MGVEDSVYLLDSIFRGFVNKDLFSFFIARYIFNNLIVVILVADNEYT
jgi:hypothetical protein